MNAKLLALFETSMHYFTIARKFCESEENYHKSLKVDDFSINKCIFSIEIIWILNIFIFTARFTLFKVRGSLEVEGYKVTSSCEYVVKIMVDPTLEQVKTVLIGKASFSESVVLRGKKLPKWNIHSTNRIKTKWGWFSTIFVIWRVLAMKVKTGRNKEFSFYENFPWKQL